MWLITLFLIGELCHTSGYIDIPPVPQYPGGALGGSITFSLPFSRSDPYPNDMYEPDPMDFTLSLHYGLGGKSEFSLSMYHYTTYSLSFSYLLKKGEGNAPSFFCGIDDISYTGYLSTIGSGKDKGFLEEKNYHLYHAGRAGELFSVYFAWQQQLGSVANFVLGLGRGRFVGYGKRSHIFNTDLFVLGESYHDTTANISAWAFGVFMGGSLKFPFGLEMMMEMDGRDANIGMKYHHRIFTPTLAITKVEHFWSPKPFSPRFTLGLEVSNRAAAEGPKAGSIECVIRDKTTKEPLLDAVVDIKEINKRYKAANGTFSLTLPAGNYTVTAIKKDYEKYMAKLSIKPGTRTKAILSLSKTQEALQREAALKEKDKNIRNYFEQGKIYYSEGNLDNARVSFQMVLSLDPNHEGAKEYITRLEARRLELIRVYTAEAKSREQAKDYTKALENWKKVLDLDPQNQEARAAIIRVQEAIAAATKPTKPTKPAKPSKPAQPTATAEDIEKLYKKGVTFFTGEKYDQALKVFKQVLALNPNHKGAKDYKKRTEARLRVLKGGG